MPSPGPTQASSAHNLKRLFLLRNLMIAGVLLALFVIILCLSQRLGLLASCSASVPVAEATQSLDSTPTAADSSSNTHGSCSLSEQLLSKAWNQLEPMLAVLPAASAIVMGPLRL